MPDLHKLKIRHMQFDINNNLWLATTTGLFVMQANKHDVQPARIARYNKAPNNTASLNENDIQYILRTRDNHMWLATSGGGLELARFNDALKGISFKHHLKSNGLLSQYILSVKEDAIGELWLGTERGLARLNPLNGKARAYDSSEGLFDPAFSEGAVTGLKGGEIVFGTFKGILKFDPLKLRDDRTATRLAFTNLQINNKDVTSIEGASFSNKNINYTRKLDLSYSQNTISLGFTVLDLEHGNDQNLMYRLQGYDKSWQNTQGERRVTYTSLPPGHYVFEIKCVNEKFYTNIPVKSLIINVSPPLWRTWWAYLLYAITAGGMIWLVFRTVKTILKLRESVRVEKKIAELKEEFFTNTSHELRTTLSLITNPLAEISQKEKLSPKGRKYLHSMAVNADRLTRFMDQWLDLRKIQSHKSELEYVQMDLVSHVKQVATSFTGNTKNITLQITSNEPVINTALDRQKIDLVIYNVLSNAYKHTQPDSSIEIHISRVNDNIELSIADEGTGVPYEKLEEIFELYFVVNAGDKVGKKGTGIGLAVAREIVNLHGGRICAENNANGGLTISISLPVISLPMIQTSPIEHSTHLIDINAHDALFTPRHLPLPDKVPQADLPTVLLVEDNFDLREMLAAQLSDHYKVLLAVDGEEGLRIAIEQGPDLIISDIMMPKMDGIAMLDKLKNSLSVSHIPVILLSARSSVQNQVQGLKYGADLYLTKPFSTPLLLASVANLIKQRQLMFNKLADKKVVSLNPGEVIINEKDELFLRKVVQVVEEGIRDPNLSVERLADAMAMGRTSFYKKFKSLTGITAVDLIRDMRLKRACQLMEAGEDRVSAVAIESGFSDAKYFSTCFKDKYHISPTEFLKSLLKPEKMR